MTLKKFFLYFTFPLIFLAFLYLQFNQYQKKHIFIEFEINEHSDLVLDFEQTLFFYSEKKFDSISLSDLNYFTQILNTIENYLFHYFINYNFTNDQFQIKDVIKIKYDSKNRHSIKKIVFKEKVSDQLISDLESNILNSINNESLSKKSNLYNLYNKFNTKINFVSKDDQIKFKNLYKKLTKKTEDYEFFYFNIEIERNLSLTQLIIYLLSTCILFILYFLLITKSNFNFFIKSNLRKYLNFDK